MAISVVQQVTGSGQSVKVSGVTAGNSLLVVWLYGNSASQSGDELPTDNHGNSYSSVVAKVYGFIGKGFNIFLAQTAAGGDTTVTISGGYSSYIVGSAVYELAGVGGVDQSASKQGASSAPSAGSMTTAYSGDFIYSVTNVYAGSASVPSGFTSGANPSGSYDAYSTQSAAGSINVTWNGSVNYWACGAVALYPAAPVYSLTWNGVSISAWDGVVINGWDGDS